jgi:hypothetical protein
MASFTIPKKQYNAFVVLFSLPDEIFQRLIENLQNLPFTFDFRDALRSAISSIQDIRFEDASSIVDALFSLYINRSNSDKSTTEYIGEFLEAARKSNSEELKQIGESREKISGRLSQIFNVSSLLLAAKARSVMLEYDNIFYKARVLTDVRPVFGEDAAETRAWMIIHNLRIHYHEGEDHKDFFVALDVKDIQKLIDSLERAKVKAETLKSVLAATNTPYIEPESE